MAAGVQLPLCRQGMAPLKQSHPQKAWLPEGMAGESQSRSSTLESEAELIPTFPHVRLGPCLMLAAELQSCLLDRELQVCLGKSVQVLCTPRPPCSLLACSPEAWPHTCAVCWPSSCSTRWLIERGCCEWS